MKTSKQVLLVISLRILANKQRRNGLGKPLRDIYDTYIVPELLPPSENGVFRALLTHPEAKPILRDVDESYQHFQIAKVEVRNAELPITDLHRSDRFVLLPSFDCRVSDQLKYNRRVRHSKRSIYPNRKSAFRNRASRGKNCRLWRRIIGASRRFLIARLQIVK